MISQDFIDLELVWISANCNQREWDLKKFAYVLEVKINRNLKRTGVRDKVIF